MKLLHTAVFLAVALVSVLPGCSRTDAESESAAASAPASAAASAPQAAVQTLTLTYDKPAIVGRDVQASVSGLPAGKEAELVWSTATGGWVIEDYYHFRGKKYAESTISLGKFPIDANGRLDARFTIPEDYGGVHDIIAMVDGANVAQNGVEVTQSFEFSPTSGPVGTPIELKVKGLGWRTMESTWVVNWDNNLVGFVSAASSKGSATARFRASGPSGAHVVKLLTGWQGQGYLNYEQSPVAHLPRPQFTFQTTPGRSSSPMAYAEPYQPQVIPKSELSVAGSTLSISPAQGPVGTRTTLRGDGFAANTSLELVWQTYVGSRVTSDGFEASEKPIGSVKVGADGRLEAPITIPDDLGGLHGLALRAGDKTIGRAFFVTETSIVGISATSGPVGTPISIHLKGVGWTEYDNIYVATYDNAYMGYACGFNSQGDVVINFVATGAPGEHIIDLYPGIYQGPQTEPQLLYRHAQLTYADDHPGNKIPALRFKFNVTGSASNETH